jgi:hypothetical protein
MSNSKKIKSLAVIAEAPSSPGKILPRIKKARKRRKKIRNKD